MPHWGFLTILLNSQGKIYLAKRAENKTLWPGYWDATIASHVRLGESLQEALERRIYEEINLRLSPRVIDSFYYFRKYNDQFAENEYCSISVAVTEKKPKPNPSEVAEIKLVDFKELKKELAENGGSYTPWLHLTAQKMPGVFTR